MATAKKKTPAAKKPAAKKRASPTKTPEQKAAAVAAAEKAKHTTALKELDPIAKEINHRLMTAEKLSDKSNDERLSASLRMAEAKAKCEKVKLSFKTWCEGHLNLGYDNARKLARIGAEGESKARILLEDMRVRSAEAQKKHAEKKRKLLAAASSPAAAKTDQPSKTPFQRAEEVVESLTDNQKVAVADKVAKSIGRVVVSEEDVKTFVALRKKQQDEEKASLLSLAKTAFDRLVAKDKMALLQYAAKITGITLEVPSFAAEAGLVEGEGKEDMPEMPEFLDRKKTTAATPRARRRKAA